jgi:hypothetical protein
MKGKVRLIESSQRGVIKVKKRSDQKEERYKGKVRRV